MICRVLAVLAGLAGVLPVLAQRGPGAWCGQMASPIKTKRAFRNLKMIR